LVVRSRNAIVSFVLFPSNPTMLDSSNRKPQLRFAAE